MSIWQDMINPALTYIGENVLPKLTESIENLWNNILAPLGSFLADVLEPIIQIASDVLFMLWDNVFSPIVNFLWDAFKPVFEDVFGSIGDMIDGLSKTFGGIIDFITGVFTLDWEMARYKRYFYRNSEYYRF